MIKHLLIKNYALIDSLQIDLEEGFTVLSGETGAGKSIILDAISLLIGKRSERGSLYDKEKKCVLELIIYISKETEYLFTKYDLDFDTTSIIRREILPTGKSRSFINDSPISLSILQDITSNMLEIYSQNQSLKLKSQDKQLKLLDKIAKSEYELSEFQEIYLKFNRLSSEINQLKEDSKLSESELEFLRFQINEIDKASLKEEEKINLESEYNVLENSSSITEKLSKMYNYISEENGMAPRLSEIENDLFKISSFSEELTNLAERISSIRIEVQDLEIEVQNINDSIKNKPEELSKIRERLDLINSLLSKHSKQNITDLLLFLDEMKIKIQSSNKSESIIKAKEDKLEKVTKELYKSAEVLTKKRKSVIKDFQKNVERHLKKLGIKSPVFIIDIQQREDFNLSGNDIISFMFSANKGSEPQEINKVASGGELSRLMLCFSYLISDHDNLSCLIFDEIDTGLSGEIADLMSEMMKEMSLNKQIISVTHLPQIASKANHHFKVYKKEMPERTTTDTKKLTSEERIEEIAKMLSGKKVTKISINNAKELLSQ